MTGFLNVNGIEFPALEQNRAPVDFFEVGERSRAEDGSLHVQSVGEGHVVGALSSLMSRETADMWAGLILGKGHRFALDTGISSSRGLTDPDAVFGQRDDSPTKSTSATRPGTKFGVGSIAIERAVANLYSSNVATGTDTSSNTTGFTAKGAGVSITSSTAQAWQGSRSLKIDTNGAIGDGAQAQLTGLTNAQPHVGVVYLRSDSGDQDVKVYLNDADNGAGTAQDITITDSEWARVEVTQTCGVTGTMEVVVESRTATTFTFYADGWMLEENFFAATWVDGSRAVSDVAFTSMRTIGNGDLTVQTWLRGPTVVAGNDPTVWTVGSKASEGLALVYDSSANSLTAIPYVGGVAQTAATDAFTVDFDWHHVAVVLRRSPATGSAKIELYVDGVLGASSNPTTLPSFDGPAFTMGNEFGGGSNILNGTLDEMVVQPYAMTAAGISDTYDARWSNLPFLDVYGESLAPESNPIEMRGSLPRLTRRTSTAAAAGEQSVQIAIRLEERRVR